jgi:hypothetical protein
MTESVKRYRRKPDRSDRDDRDEQSAARYDPGRSLDGVMAVARMADSYRVDAELAEVMLPSGPVLLVRYERAHDEHPSEIDYEVVEPGQWLAWSPGNGFLYATDDANWRQFYDLVPEEAQ